MAIHKALVNKLKRRRRYLNKYADKMSKQDDVMARSPAFGLMLSKERRMDKALGFQALPSPDKALLEKLRIVDELERVDFGSSDYGLRLTMAEVNAGAKEETEITTIAETGTFEEFLLTAPAESASSQGDYFTFAMPDGNTYAVWLNIDSDDTEPTGASYLAANETIEVAITNGMTAAQVGTAIYNALDGAAIPSLDLLDNTDGTLEFIIESFDNESFATTYNADGTTTTTNLTITIQEVAELGLAGKAFKISAPGQDYVVYFVVEGLGEIPVYDGAAVFIEVALSYQDADSDVASAIASVLDFLPAFEASSASEVVTVESAEVGAAIDAEDIDSGMSFSTEQQGEDADNRKSFKALKVMPGDIITILGGVLKGKEYKVIDMPTDNILRLEDDAAWDEVSEETDILVRIRFSGSKKSYY